MPPVCFSPSKAPLPGSKPFCDLESAHLSRCVFCLFSTLPTCYYALSRLRHPPPAPTS